MAKSIHPITAAIRHQMKGELKEAEAIYRKVLHKDPRNPDATHLLGVIAYQRKEYGKAIDLITRAISLNRTQPAFFCNLGLAYAGLGDYENAIARYRKALAMNPSYVEAHNNLGNACREMGKTDEAIESYGRALAFSPGSVETLYNMGTACHEGGRLGEAMDLYLKALALMPGSPEINNNLGLLYKDMGDYEKARERIETAVSLDPLYPDSYANLGTLSREAGDAREAVDFYGRALRMSPSPGTRVKAAMVLPVIMDSVEEIHRWRERLEHELTSLEENLPKIADPLREVGATNFYLAYHGLNNRDLQVRIARLYEASCPSLSYVAPHCEDGSTVFPGDRKIRIGFPSRFLRDHTVGKYVKGIITNLSPHMFDVYLYMSSAVQDGLTAQLARSAAKTTTLPPSLEVARRRIADDRLDILFYPEVGMDPFTYFLAFSRLAPVQCALYGHPDTTGIASMDFFISHELCETYGAESMYSEKLFKISSESVYTSYSRPSREDTGKKPEDFGIDGNSHLYFCPHALFKIHPDMDDLIRDILDGDPLGVVAFFEGSHPNWTTRLMARLSRTVPSSRGRVAVLPRMGHHDYLTLTSHACAMLDTPHFSGGNATFDALSTGIPIVTWPGPSMRSRQTAALYRRMGIGECTVHDRDGYVSTALRLGNDPDFRERVGRSIEERADLIFGDMGVVKELERFFVDALEDRVPY